MERHLVLFLTESLCNSTHAREIAMAFEKREDLRVHIATAIQRLCLQSRHLLNEARRLHVCCRPAG